MPIDIGWIAIVLQLIFLEDILSIDNAALLGALVSPLPHDRPIPWPRSLQPLGRRLDPLLGGQRHAALKVGLLGAYVGRGAMLLVAHLVIRNPWLHLVGGGYLIYVAAEHLAPAGTDTASSPATALDRHTAQAGFWRTVLAVELADLAFSLDNVVAAVALSRNMAVVLLGVALGILTMRVAAGVFADLIEREPILAPAAYLLVLVIGLRLIAGVLFHVEISAVAQLGLSLAILAAALVYARLPFGDATWLPARLVRPFIRGIQHAIGVCLRALKSVTVRSLGAVISLVLTLWGGS